MDKTLHALGELLLKALPTFFLVLLLYFYLKLIFFRPLERVLRARFDSTEGTRRLAEATLEKASQKAAEYEAALRAARGDIYREQEEFRRRWKQEHAAAVEQARAKAGGLVKEAKAQLALEVAHARQSLSAGSESLADQIARAILERRAS